MVGVPRSQEFIVGQITTPGFTPEFIVPPNHIALIKAFDLHNLSTDLATFYFGFISVASGVNIYVGQAQLAANEIKHFDVWTVAHPGDQLWCYANLAPATFVCSGALLAGGPVVPPVTINGPARATLEIPSTQPM